MKTRLLLVFTVLIFTTSAFAQKEAAIWYFGNYAGLDFNSGSPIALTNGKLNTAEGCTTISDKNGNLLFYTDGSIVYNKSHQVMPNGYGLLGHNSSTQSAIIVPHPSNLNLYYIFTVDQPNPKNVDDNLLNDEDPPNNGLNYTLVDLRLNNGLGDISVKEKNIHLITYNPGDSEEIKFKCSEKITAVQHGDGTSFWVITHFKNTFYSFKISTSGVDKKPIQTTTSLNVSTGGYISNAIGYLKTSPNGKKIAMANTSFKATDELGPKGEIRRNTGNVWLFDFDAATGKISNGFSIVSGINPYGVEFSAKSKKLYVTTNLFRNDDVSLGSLLIQFDLKSANIIGSKTTINSSTNVAGALQLALDEKIYRSGYPSGNDSSDKLSVINNPELDGSNCNYLQNEIDLGGKKAKLGLPPFITSLFLYAFNYEFNCLGESTHFYSNSVEKIDSVLWNFGDGFTSTAIDAYHTYAQAGEYKVTLIKTVNGEEREPLEKAITIYEVPKILSASYKLTQCDTQDSVPTDGLALFNLSLANEPISLGEKDFEVHYYHSIADAENDLTNTQSLPVNYRNSFADELTYAKVSQSNSSCYSIGTVILHANKNILLLPEALHECDLGDGKASFDLERKKDLIKTELTLPSDVRLSFYLTEEDAFIGINELNGPFVSVPKTVFLRAENAEGCYGTGNFEIIVEPSPKINILENVILCEGLVNPSILLNAGILAPATIYDFTYLWSTGETTPTISINKQGEYNVSVKNKSGCTTSRKYIVTMSYLAKINNIIVQDLQQTNQVIVELDNPSDYEYKLHYENGTETSFQNSILFENVPGGFHELIVANRNGCGQTTKSFAVLNAPKFFTPNGDSYNDYWNLKGINSTIYENAIIYIFDRYGKLLKQLSPSSLGWDGNYLKQPLPADDYWFTIKLEDGREAKSHFSLKR
ncbi:T9SS type B sorting domain-containing protein [Flavobacterium xueshanense]|uniref:Gliding motility-associated C-terminal domain-containing protein n=1 Tax=Flavobacterium xueshanense TaxID=935223 RepID=A0A1I2FPD6_9FLAO|nr:T9SS type B sorting domain-containing protein [Flavobacterium xueshanense]SFF06638.1 gliding motility-associated C-terminal domain-containing protein [Flavobacterium xueshanense]